MSEPARILDTNVFIGGEEGTVNKITIGKSTDTVVVAGAQTLEAAQTFSVDVTMADSVDIIVNATTGTVIATAVTQKLAFWGATPVVQPADVLQAAPAAYATGAFGLDSDANMEALYDLVVEIRTALVDTGIMKGAA